MHFPFPLHVPLQHSVPVVHMEFGCPNIEPGAQQTLLFWVSQLFEQQSVLALHCIETAAHMPPSPAASLAGGPSVAESPDVVPSEAGPSEVEPSVCIAGPSPGGCESWDDDVSCMFGASIVLGASGVEAES
jgi:hypothetical protein